VANADGSISPQVAGPPISVPPAILSMGAALLIKL
jgi:hypothetical protein